MTLRRTILTTLMLAPLMAFAQAPADLSDDQVRCLRTGLTEAGFTLQEVDDLFAGRIADAEAFVKSRLSEAQLAAIGSTCFPGGAPTPGPTGGPGQVTITPEQRACITQYIDADLLDRMLRGELRPEDVLSRERMEEIGRACFAYEGEPAPGEHPPGPPIDLPPDVIACLKREVGEQAFNEVSSGQRPPTPEEYAKGERCFPKQGPGGPGGIADLPEATKQCIRGIIGDKFNRALELKQTGGSPESLLTPEEMRKIGETCFGGPGGVPPGGGPPTEAVACVRGVVGEARLQEFLRGGTQPTPDELRQLEAAGCFPKGVAGAPGHPGGRGGPSAVPPEVRACLEGALGTQRAAELLGGRSEPTPEELQKAQACFGAGGPGPGPTGPPDREQCVRQCVAYQAPDGRRYSEGECSALCSGQRPPPPGPTGPPQPGPTPGYDQCVQQCKTYEGGRYSVGDYCERVCRGELVQPPGGPPAPTGQPPPPNVPPTSEPTPFPTPDISSCVAGCTGYPKYDASGNQIGSYSTEECTQLCGGSVQGIATERIGVPWWLRLLRTLVGG